MKYSMRLFAAVALGSFLALSSAAQADQIKLRATGSFTKGHGSTLGMEVFQSELKRLSGGDMTIDLFPGSQLGSATSQVEMVRTGQIAIGWMGPSFWSSVLPEIDASTLPFAAGNPQQAFCMIDGGLGDYLNTKLEAKGVTILGWAVNGARHVTNNTRPIKTLADIKGLKLRVPPSDTYISTFRALGVNATPVDINELYQALQQGVVDGQENPYGNILVRNFNEVQKYLSNTGHFYSWTIYVMNKKVLDEMSPEHQEAIHEAAFRATAAGRALGVRQNASARADLIARGMQYDEISAKDLAEFRDATRPVYDAFRERVGDEVVDVAMTAINKCQ